MARISQVYRLANSQAEVDFVDVELNADTPLYLDPYAIQLKKDEWSMRCGEQIRSFFSALLEALREGNMARAQHFLANLHEPNETRLGVSKGKPQGRAVGAVKAEALASAIVRSRAFVTGLLDDISEAEMFVKFIGSDTISDMVTNVVRKLLAEYTLE